MHHWKAVDDRETTTDDQMGIGFHTNTLIRTHARTHALTHTRARARTHTQTHTHKNAHTHITYFMEQNSTCKLKRVSDLYVAHIHTRT